MVSHELRTPLANLKAYAETLTVTKQLDLEKQKDFCNIINAEATRLARLVDDLLSISSMEVGSLSLVKEETDMERMMKEVVDKVSPQMDKKFIVMNTTFPEKWPKLHVDKDKMTGTLVNLLGNAVKYTPSGGRVTLRVKVHDTLSVAMAEPQNLPQIDEIERMTRLKVRPIFACSSSIQRLIPRYYEEGFEVDLVTTDFDETTIELQSDVAEM